MAFHQRIQNILLAGHKFPPRDASAPPLPPAQLAALVDAIAPSYEGFNARAMEYGNRYRSAFWAIYLLSALAVLFAVLPLALGWDNAGSGLSHYAVIFVVGEILVILAIALAYWRGHQQDWQGQWLAERTKAELAWYLPLVAPLVDFDHGTGGNWYARLYGSGDAHTGDAVDALCTANEELARSALAGAWANPAFVLEYARWTVNILIEQRDYHCRVHQRQHALLHRVHAINTWLFGLTGLAALAHLVVHSRLLTLVTTVLPALGASLHGALAQSEAYRLQASSARLASKLELAIDAIAPVFKASDPLQQAGLLRGCVRSAIEVIMDEHQDWHMLVRPHHLPLG